MGLHGDKVLWTQPLLLSSYTRTTALCLPLSLWHYVIWTRSFEPFVWDLCTFSQETIRYGSIKEPTLYLFRKIQCVKVCVINQVLDWESETSVLWMNVSTEWGWGEVSQMKRVHYEPDRVNESTRLHPTWQRVGKPVQQPLHGDVQSDLNLLFMSLVVFVKPQIQSFKYCSVKFKSISSP